MSASNGSSLPNSRLPKATASTQRTVPLANNRKKQAADALSQRYDQLNALWAQAEGDLKGIPVPHDVHVLLWPADPTINEFESGHLGFARCDDGWRICFGTTQDFVEFGWKPILDCTVDVRLRAISKVNELREAVLKAAEDCVSKVDKAIDELRNNLANW